MYKYIFVRFTNDNHFDLYVDKNNQKAVFERELLSPKVVAAYGPAVPALAEPNIGTAATQLLHEHGINPHGPELQAVDMRVRERAIGKLPRAELDAEIRNLFAATAAGSGAAVGSPASQGSASE